VARLLGAGTSAVNRLAAREQVIGLDGIVKVVLEPTSPSFRLRFTACCQLLPAYCPPAALCPDSPKGLRGHGPKYR